MHKEENKYDVVIIGGGITGASLLYVLSNYTDIKRIALIEKYGDYGLVNTNHNNNSQTLHFGDIETNYSLEKASRVKEAADMLVVYLEKYAKEAFIKGGKMVIAVGESEITELKKRFEEFKTLFPNLKLINRKELENIEPKIIEGRSHEEKIIAIYT
ncbi:MAG: FAD-dependent oxidoreductase, partial [Candidatus Yanofskybacteria bacterium]|nr:FAD-dependent oxidoreductase [Candidatus Yanofskybacteria bacterium]